MEIFQSVFQNIWRNGNCFLKNWIKILQESLHVISCSLKLYICYVLLPRRQSNYHDMNFYREYTCTAIRKYLVALFIVRKRQLKSVFARVQTSSRLFHLVQMLANLSGVGF